MVASIHHQDHPDENGLVQRVMRRPLWLAMLLTFLGLTLLFLAGLALHWCYQRQLDDTASAAGTYSPPIGCYSKVGATIQFGTTWVSLNLRWQLTIFLVVVDRELDLFARLHDDVVSAFVATTFKKPILPLLHIHHFYYSA